MDTNQTNNMHTILAMEEAVDYCLEEKLKGREYPDLEEELRSNGWLNEDIQTIIRKTDDSFLSRLIENNTTPSHHNTQKTIGRLLFIFGITFSFLSYTGIINFGDYYIILTGPIAAGLAMMASDLKARTFIKRKRTSRSPYARWKR